MRNPKEALLRTRHRQRTQADPTRAVDFSASKTSQDASKTTLHDGFLFWNAFFIDLGSIFHPNLPPTIVVCRAFDVGNPRKSKWAPDAHQERPKTPQRPPKTAQDVSKTA